jgi:hypothetical protein
VTPARCLDQAKSSGCTSTHNFELQPVPTVSVNDRHVNLEYFHEGVGSVFWPSCLPTAHDILVVTIKNVLLTISLSASTLTRWDASP